jgi:DNA mismatch repair protein mutS
MGLSPMMKQYFDIKEQYKDCLLMYRLGDFYELFFDDALITSRELELTLTGRNCGLEERAPMCGVPFHAANSYIAKLVAKGYKVAICEQIEDPKEAKGIVKREVIRIITPGTIDIDKSTNAKDNLYLASVYITKKTRGIAYTDITTGEFTALEVRDDHDNELLISELVRISPKEIIYFDETSSDFIDLYCKTSPGTYINTIDESYFKYSSCEDILLSQFEVTSLIPLDIQDKREVTIASGSLLLYLMETEKHASPQIKHLILKESGLNMILDRSTMRNLELIETQYNQSQKGSLLDVLDKTHTAMGGRLIRRFIKEPLKDSDAINKRLDAVETLVDLPVNRANIVSSLKHVYDFERLTARIASMRANGKDLIALKTTIRELPSIKDELCNIDTPLLNEIYSSLDDFSELEALIENSIVEEPPFTITDGDLIKPGYSEELDSLKLSIKDAKEWITGLETREKERTGIKNLKVGFNKVFGYYIDISKSNLPLVPDDYIRKQTLVNNERYITPELKEKESLVLSAEAKINNIEYEIFKEVRASIEPYFARLQRASASVALLDVLTSLADVASRYGYVKPIVDDSSVIDIKEGRHPAVEQMIGEGLFVSNSTLLDTVSRSMLIITGPNMSGKSTYMRQTAIIVLMAQIGSFVPCEHAHIGAVDRVFTRIGASDNLSHGQSTFYIEMSELANILRNATERSLIILDEIGRGTSTFDGLSIAWATIEFLSKPGNCIRTMFATHYHELTVLESKYANVKNLSVAVSEQGSDIVFLHKISEQPASKSYGIHVAKIAGVPSEIRKKAASKLRELESGSSSSPLSSDQISFFGQSIVADDENEYEEIIDEIKDINLNNITPMEAMLKLKEIQDKVK